MRQFYSFVAFFILITSGSFGQAKILFDATKAESAGNTADWVIDADLHNINWSPGPKTGGTHSNPQRIPTPAQSTITASTPETYWTGALSSWGIDCVNKGYTVETLPYTGKITYGDATNVQDLSNYTVFAVCEPNIQFTVAEKTAMMEFIKNGGGLFMISDHAGADRNSDGWDARAIWDDFIKNNSLQANPFGIYFDSASFSGTFSNLAALPANDTLLHGPMGNVTTVKWSSGTSLTISPSANQTVKAVIYKSGTSGNSNVLCAYARYGKGRVVAIGDSSPFDDGTGNPSSTLYTGYTGDVSGNHQRLIMNATIWLATLPIVTPVKFVSARGNNTNGTTTLVWQADETNLQANSYQIERSNDGINFLIAGNVTAKKTGSVVATYQWQAAENINGSVYYRIVANENGSKTYSQVIALGINGSKQVSIYPNPSPANYAGTFTISGLQNGTTISISNLQGKRYYQAVATGTNAIWNGCNNKGLKVAAGIYIVSVKDAGSAEYTAGKIVVTGR
ncbi:T9SS type A sorting domain-containing protein [Parasediminibacterium sp. JCM 36343]|uniref:T9SS type A sorting domain-containing protein n=1 Tax=Parasediminibacterium sp. JCM 36343 TaxID=3374279 RepID=UPI00397E8701